MNGTGFVGNDNRPDTGFGLLSHDVGGVAFGFDYIPSDAVSVGASYQYEKYSALQKSRQANPGVSSTIRRETGRPTAAITRTR